MKDAEERKDPEEAGMFSVSSSMENMTINFQCSDWCGIEQGTTHECKVRKIMSVSENLKEREAREGKRVARVSETDGKRVWIVGKYRCEQCGSR